MQELAQLLPALIAFKFAQSFDHLLALSKIGHRNKLNPVQSHWADLNLGPAWEKDVSSDFNQTAKQLQRAASTWKPLSHFAMQWWHRTRQCTDMRICVLLSWCSLLPHIVARCVRQNTYLWRCVCRNHAHSPMSVWKSRAFARDLRKISSRAQVFDPAHHATTGKKIWCLWPLHNRQCS